MTRSARAKRKSAAPRVSPIRFVAADDQKYVSFEVTPVALTGASPGAPVESPLRGPVGQLHPDWSQTALGAIRGGAIGEAALFWEPVPPGNCCLASLQRQFQLVVFHSQRRLRPAFLLLCESAYKLVRPRGTYVVGVQDNGGSNTELFSPQNLGFAAGDPISAPTGTRFLSYTATRCPAEAEHGRRCLESAVAERLDKRRHRGLPAITLRGNHGRVVKGDVVDLPRFPNIP